MADRPALESWFKTWHPNYKRALIKLSAFAVALGAWAYVENALLAEFSRSFARVASSNTPAPTRDIVTESLFHAAARLKWSVPILILVLYGAGRLLRTALEMRQRRTQALLQHQSKSDLEGAVLVHLMAKDDAFFTSRPPAEIINRLGGDIARVIDERISGSQERQSILLIAGNLFFFARQSPMLAIAGASICGLSAWLMERLTRPVKEMDRVYLGSDDRVKARFEDLLRAAPEVQVGNFSKAVSAEFAQLQGERRNVYMKYVSLNSYLSVLSSISYLLAFISLCAVPLYFLTSEAPDMRAALIPVILRALPDLFGNSQAIILQRLSRKLADTSKARLLEYESGHADDVDDSSPINASSLSLRNVTYQYTSAEGKQQGGVVELSSDFKPGTWVAVVGGAGAGKSTMLQLLLGRMKAATGTITIGEESLADMPAARRARHITVMPQTVALLDGSVRENLLLGRRDGEIDFDLLERSGVAAICRTKALGMLATTSGDFANTICSARRDARRVLEEKAVKVRAFSEGGFDSTHWLSEVLLQGKCDRKAALDRLFGSGMRRALDALAGTTIGDELIQTARSVIVETRPLLELSSFQKFSKLSPVNLDERIWAVRTSLVSAAAKLNAAQRRAALQVALTVACSEIPEAQLEKLTAAKTDSLTELFGSTLITFDDGAIHPHLTWKENLIFGAVDIRNSRVEQNIELTLLEFLEARGLTRQLTEIGLDSPVGRAGTRLSGGQRQLVALCRALGRRTPIVILDEPTSALDPASRSRVAGLLKESRGKRIFITVSHDPEFVKEADEVRLLKSGRIVASGTFQELREHSQVFQETLRVS